MSAERDCERIGDGFFGQPVNSITTLVIVVAGTLVWTRPRMRWVGAALVGTGLGSLVFHGPMPAWSEWVHDVPLVWLLIVVAGWGRSWERWTHWPSLAGISILLGLSPVLADLLAVVFTVVALVSLLARDRSMSTLGPLLLLAGAAIVGRLGATGGPLCEPDSIWQWHGLWHVGAAVAVCWWALTRDGAEPDPDPAPALY